MHCSTVDILKAFVKKNEASLWHVWEAQRDVNVCRFLMGWNWKSNKESVWVKYLLFILYMFEKQLYFTHHQNRNSILLLPLALLILQFFFTVNTSLGVQKSCLAGRGWFEGMQQNKSYRFSQMIGSLHCNLRDNGEQAECIMHYSHRQEEAWVKRGQPNVVICFAQSLQLGIFIWCIWRKRWWGWGVKKLEECRWITVWNT